MAVLDQVGHHCEQEADSGIHHAGGHEAVPTRRSWREIRTPASLDSSGDGNIPSRWSGKAALVVTECGKSGGVGSHLAGPSVADWSAGFNMSADSEQGAADQLQGAILEALEQLGHYNATECGDKIRSTAAGGADYGRVGRGSQRHTGSKSEATPTKLRQTCDQGGMQKLVYCCRVRARSVMQVCT